MGDNDLGEEADSGDEGMKLLRRTFHSALVHSHQVAGPPTPHSDRIETYAANCDVASEFVNGCIASDEGEEPNYCK